MTPQQEDEVFMAFAMLAIPLLLLWALFPHLPWDFWDWVQEVRCAAANCQD